MIRLFIENKEADITEGFSHQITYSIDDLENLDSKTTSFSKTIVLPGTSRNNYLLGNIFEFSNSNFNTNSANIGYNFNASKSAKCILFSDGINIIKGVLRLMKIIRDKDNIEYEVAIFGELGGLFSKLQNKKLTDLDFSQYNHQYNVSNIVSSWDGSNTYQYVTSSVGMVFNNNSVKIYGSNLTTILKPNNIFNLVTDTNNNDGDYLCINITYNTTQFYTEIIISENFTTNEITGGTFSIQNTKGFGYYYPLIDYGNYSTNKIDYKVNTFRPAFYVYEYINKIITEAGYTYESKFFETDFFKRLIIPHSESKLMTNRQDLFRGWFYGDDLENIGNTIRTINSDVLINKNFGNSFSTSDNKVFTYNGTTTTSLFNFQLSLNIVSVSNAWNIDIVIYLNGSPTANIQSFSGFDSSALLASFIAIPITLNNGDTISVHINGSVHSSSGGSGYEVLGNGFNINYQYPVIAEVQYNDNLEVNNAIPKNILQKDFFASILKMFYLMVTEDKYKSKHLIITPWTWFYNLNKESYLDWSMKLDRSQTIKIEPMSEANARYYDIKYKQDNDYFNEFYRKRYNEGYGDVRYDNQLEFAKDAETTEVIFSSTPLLGYTGEDKIVPAIFKWDGKIVGTNEENVNSNIRIMQRKKIEDIENWNILDASGTTISTINNRYPYAGHFDDPDVPGSDLNFGATKELFFSLSSGALGNNLFNTFYSSYLAEITDKDSRLVTAKFKLNDTDIFNLDFGRFIWLDGVLYRLSKIVDYTPGEICTVELLRVIYTTYDVSVNSADVPEIYINGLTWQTKNYEGEYYRNGDPIPQITDASEWGALETGAWCYYRNETDKGIEYGKLYNWFAINDARGFAPEGYHVPDDIEWASLFDTNSNAYAWKESGVTHWNTDNGTDLYGFKALGGGERETDGTFSNLKVKARFWSADEYDTDLAKAVGIDNASATIFGDKLDKNYGFSVRLVRD